MRVRDYQRGKIHVPKSKSGYPRDIVLTEAGQAFFESITMGRASDEPLFTRADGSAWKQPEESVKTDVENLPRGQDNTADNLPRSSPYLGQSSVIKVPIVVARNLGHTTTTMVEKFYGHLSDSYTDPHKGGGPTLRFGDRADQRDPDREGEVMGPKIVIGSEKYRLVAPMRIVMSGTAN